MQSHDSLEPLRRNLGLLWFALVALVLLILAVTAIEYVRYRNAEKRYVATLNACTALDNSARAMTDLYWSTRNLPEAVRPKTLGTPPPSFDIVACFRRAQRPRFPY